jgi:hypothetical protein
MAQRGGYVYILASRRNGTLYIGVTSDIPARMTAHREGRGSAFVKSTASSCSFGVNIIRCIPSRSSARRVSKDGIVLGN